MIRGDVIELNNGKKVMLNAVDAVKIIADVSHLAFIDISRNSDGIITSISFEDKETIAVGDEIETVVGAVKSKYKIVEIIVDVNETTVVFLTSIISKVSNFMLPILGKTKQDLKFNTYFVNSFIDETHKYIGILYRFTGTELYKKFEEKMISDKLCVKHIEYDPYHVMYVFKIPEEFAGDVELFFKGKYSKLSSNAKNAIAKFHSLMKESYISQVLNQSEKLKKNMEKELGTKLPESTELASIPIIEKETFKIK